MRKNLEFGRAFTSLTISVLMILLSSAAIVVASPLTPDRSPTGPSVLPSPVSPQLERESIDAAELDTWIASVVDDLPAALQDDPYAIIDGCAAAEMEAIGAPGASIAIAIDGVITYTKGYGVKHRDDGGEIDPETMFRIGSTTKMMTAAALLTLAEENAIEMHAPITEALPDFELPAPWDASALTAHHLLSHQGGIPDGYGIRTFEQLNTMSLEHWAIELLPRMALLAPPGTFWNYSNPNFSLAGYIIEVLSGMPHSEYTEANVWEPAGMPLTTYDADSVITHGNFAWGHDATTIFGPDFYPLPAIAPAGTAYSTPSEMVTWALTLVDEGGDVLTPESAAAMQAPHVSTGYVPWEQYGYGVFITDYRDREDETEIVSVLDHGGNVPGWGSQLYWIPERDLVVSILDNTMNSMGYTARCVLRELGGVVPRSTAGMTTEPESWDGFEGTYAMMNQVLWDFTFRISREGDYLVRNLLEEGAVSPMMNAISNTFFIDADLDGEPDPATASLDYTFIEDPRDSDGTRWIRNRLQVGERVGQFPASVAIDPAVPISQDDPDDPSSASFVQDIRIDGEAGYFLAVAVPQAGDTLAMYLMRDDDEDGTFTYPDELFAEAFEGGSNARVMNLSGRPPAGDYQLWVHGAQVAGDDHTFLMQSRIVQGDHLRIDRAPERLVTGEAAEVEVCAQGIDGLDEPLSGLVEFDYGSPPRRIRIPVEWAPTPVYTIYMPLGLRAHEMPVSSGP